MPVYDMEEGVRYSCQRCGNCCRWPGEVPVSEEELVRMAEFLGLPPERFAAEFTELRANRSGLALKEKPGGECILLDGIDCRVQPVKPFQCAAFPNGWNFPGWRRVCEALPVPAEAAGSGQGPQKGKARR